MKKYFYLFLSLFEKGKLKDKIATVYELELSGIIMIRSLLNQRGISSEDEFVFEINSIQTKYLELGFDINFTGDKFKIEFLTSSKIITKNSFYLEDFINDLQSTFSFLSPEKYMIQVNVKGNFENIYELNRFVVSNNKNKIGININSQKKFFSMIREGK